MQQRKAHAYVAEDGYVYDIRPTWGAFKAVCYLVIGAALIYAAVAFGVFPAPRAAHTLIVPQPTPALPSPYPTRPAPAAVVVTVIAPTDPPAWVSGGGDSAALNGPAYVDNTPTPAPLPQPGQPGFAGTFQEPTCSAMIGYLPGHPCYGRAGQAPLPGAGSSEFKESFK